MPQSTNNQLKLKDNVFLLVHLVESLASPGGTTLQVLARELDRDPRSIRRYMQSLRDDFQLDIEIEPSDLPGDLRYKLRELPSPGNPSSKQLAGSALLAGLSDQEQVILKLALQHLKSYGQQNSTSEHAIEALSFKLQLLFRTKSAKPGTAIYNLDQVSTVIPQSLRLTKPK